MLRDCKTSCQCRSIGNAEARLSEWRASGALQHCKTIAWRRVLLAVGLLGFPVASRGTRDRSSSRAWFSVGPLLGEHLKNSSESRRIALVALLHGLYLQCLELPDALRDIISTTCNLTTAIRPAGSTSTATANKQIILAIANATL